MASRPAKSGPHDECAAFQTRSTLSFLKEQMLSKLKKS